jgi:hypothetical protein
VISKQSLTLHFEVFLFGNLVSLDIFFSGILFDTLLEGKIVDIEILSAFIEALEKVHDVSDPNINF